MTMSKAQIAAALREKLEANIRRRLEVEIEKKLSQEAFRDELTKIDQERDGIISELDDCQAMLPFGE